MGYVVAKVSKHDRYIPLQFIDQYHIAFCGVVISQGYVIVDLLDDIGC